MDTFTRFEVKTYSRKKGHSAVAGSAYRGGKALYCERTEKLYSFKKKKDVLFNEWSKEFKTDLMLWNTAEKAEKRKDATVQREFLVSMDNRITPENALKLTRNFCRDIQDRHGCLFEFAIHKGRGGDNLHAHIILTTRKFENGQFTSKTRELDDRKSGEIDRWRYKWKRQSETMLKKQLKPERAQAPNMRYELTL